MRTLMLALLLGLSKTAGNAGVLVKGKTYVLTLATPHADARSGKTLAWEAKQIDDAP